MRPVSSLHRGTFSNSTHIHHPGHVEPVDPVQSTLKQRHLLTFFHNEYDICGSEHVDCYIIYPSPLYRNFISWSCSSLGPHIRLF